MSDASHLNALVERVEAGGGRDFNLDVEIWCALGWAYEKRGKDRKPWLYGPEGEGFHFRRDPGDGLGWLLGRMGLTSSLDAAVALVERVLPEANCHGYDATPKGVEAYVSRNCIPPGERAWSYEGMAKSPARALLAATLRALLDHTGQRSE